MSRIPWELQPAPDHFCRSANYTQRAYQTSNNGAGSFLRLFLFFIAVATITKASGSLEELNIAKAKTDVLAGRLAISLPNGATSGNSPRNIMAAAQPEAEETQIVIDAGKERMVLMISELFARVVDDFAREAQTEIGPLKKSVRIQEQRLAVPLRAVEYVPIAPRNDQEANLVMGLFVAQADGSVQQFVWYANAAAAAQPAIPLKLARSMTKTIVTGNRTLHAPSGEREVSGYSRAKSVYITLPQGYVITVQQGVDFVVPHIRKIRILGEPSADIGIYLGDFPSPGNGGFTKGGMDLLFGKRVQWYHGERTEDGRKVLTAGALVDLRLNFLGNASSKEYSGASFADVFLTAGDTSTLDELKTIAKTLRIGDRKERH